MPVDFVAFQFGDSGSLTTLLLILLIVLYPRLLLWQTVFLLESKLRELEEYSKASKNMVLRKISKQPGHKLRQMIDSFMSFFVIEPVSLDPYGVVKKLEHVLDESETRFERFVDKIAPAGATAVDKANIKYGLMGALSVTQIYKLIRHHVILIKKTGNLQIALVLQMVMPILMKLAKAEVKATDAFIRGIPIGDAIGPLVAASFKTKAGKAVAKDVIVSEERIAGRKVWVMKANGPGGALGKLGQGVEHLVRKNKIDHIITIDAAGKLEGERTGEVAEGVGVAIGGPGVERYRIEEMAAKYDLPIDSILIKQAPEEAPAHLKKDIYDALETARESVARIVKESKRRRILVVGVGNTRGIGNTAKEVQGLDKKLKPIWAKQKEEEEEEKRRLKKFWRRGASS